jgi:hypothetical protein
MSSDEPTKDDVVKKPDVDEKKDASDPADGEELRFTPEEEEVGLFISCLIPPISQRPSLILGHMSRCLG